MDDATVSKRTLVHATKLLEEFPELSLEEIVEHLEMAAAVFVAHKYANKFQWPTEFPTLDKPESPFNLEDPEHDILDDDPNKVGHRPIERGDNLDALYRIMAWGPEMRHIPKKEGSARNAPRHLTVEPWEEAEARRKRNRLIDKINALREADGRKPMPKERWKGEWLPGSFTGWCVDYSLRWYREFKDPDAELKVGGKNNDVGSLASFSQCGRLAYRMAEFADFDYHPKHLWARLNPKETKKK